MNKEIHAIVPYYSHLNNQYYTLENDKLTIDKEVIQIINGIPRFVESSDYTESFGIQWNRYRKTQLDSYTKTTITESRMQRCIGDTFHNLNNKKVLEIGCGAGRFTEILLNKGAKVVSVDLSTAVDANKINFPISENHQILQADLMKLPFKYNEFDVVLCLGVIQHTPDPKKSIEAIYKHVKSGGQLVIDHYTHSLAYYTKSKMLFRKLLRLYSPDKRIKITENLVKRLFPLHKKVRNNKILRPLLSRISPIASYLHVYPELSDDIQLEWSLVDTHDSMTDYYKHFRTKKQINKYLIDIGAKDIECWYGGNGIEARCIHP